jgi:hypothetical protein
VETDAKCLQFVAGVFFDGPKVRRRRYGCRCISTTPDEIFTFPKLGGYYSYCARELESNVIKFSLKTGVERCKSKEMAPLQRIESVSTEKRLRQRL